jgi:hypothetical protein
VYKYLAESWKGLIQGLVGWIDHGNYHVCVCFYPVKKDPAQISDKLIRKYRCDTEKTKRWRARRNGLATFAFMAFGHKGYIMHTDGELPSYCNDQFQDVRLGPIRVTAGPSLVFTIKIEKDLAQNKEMAVVRLSERTVREIKGRLTRALRTGKKALVLEEYIKLDRIAAWSGVIDQKADIVRWLLGQARASKVRLRRDELPFATFREIVPVYKQNH